MQGISKYAVGIVRAGLLLVVLLTLSSGFAQSALTVELFANALDQQASASGFPNGNQSIQPVEQSLAVALYEEVTNYSQSMSRADDFGPEVDAWLAEFDQHVGEFNQQMEQAGADAPIDVRAQIISDAVDQYGRDLEEVGSVQPLDPRAQAISDAVDEYSRYVDSLKAEAPRDPRAEAISAAVDEYSRYVDSLNAQPVIDPRAEAVSHAVAQYVASVENEDPATVRRSVSNATRQAINQSGVRHPNLVRQHMDNLIIWEVPSSLLPINGNWRVQPFEMVTSGQCIDTSGDNGGMGFGEGEEDPGQPLCGYANPGGLPFITWSGGTHPYLPGTGSIYSQEPLVMQEVIRNSSGATIGSLQRTITTEYRVVAPDLIEVHIVDQEEGGCTREGTFNLELVTADESVCPALISIETPVPISTPVAGTPDPNATPAPIMTEPAPIIRGLYLAGEPQYTDPQVCGDVNTPPQFAEVNIDVQDDGSLLLDYGTGTQVVYSLGDGMYQYDSGNDASPRYDIFVYIEPDGIGNISWSQQDGSGNICYAMIDIAVPGAELAEPTPTPDAASSDSGTIETIVVPDGSFSVTWAPIPGLECPEALLPTVPTFTEATLTTTADGVVIETADTSYLLTNQGGNWVYMDFKDDGSGASLSLSQVMDDGTVTGSFNSFNPSGDFCLMQFTFTP